MWESPTELISSRDQITVLALLEARPDTEKLASLTAECRRYLE